LANFLYSPSSASCAAGILQKSLPKLLITLPESVGGSIEQQKKSFERLQASTFKPLDFPLALAHFVSHLPTADQSLVPC
jgi:hypothetical protein